MPTEKYVPKHRDAPPQRVRRRTTNVVRLSGIAIWATGISVVGGVLGSGAATPVGTQVSAGQAQLSSTDLADRQERASRSGDDRRTAAANLKSIVLRDTKGVAVTRTEDLSVADPRTLARALMPQYGLDADEFSCLDSIWSQESGWNVHADNPHSSAYGIPQALPGSKMSSAGGDWQNSAETQIRWGLDYIQSRYGTACSAWSFKLGHGWY